MWLRKNKQFPQIVLVLYTQAVATRFAEVLNVVRALGRILWASWGEIKTDLGDSFAEGVL